MVLDAELRNKPLTELNKAELENFETAKKLFDYYDNIPIIVEFKGEKFNVLHDQITRNLIIKVLGKGILDLYPTTNEEKKRRALSGMEILENVNEMIDKNENGKLSGIGKIKKANLFFHLKKLEEADFLQEIGVIKSGRRRTTYYGRTAKIYITFDLPQGPNYEIIENDNFVKFIKSMNPQIDEEQIKGSIRKLDTLNEQTSRYFMEWVLENERHFKDTQLNFIELMKIIGLMHRFTNTTIDGLNDLSELLHIDMRKLRKID